MLANTGVLTTRGTGRSHKGLVPRSRPRRRRNRYGRSGFDRDLIIRLLAPVVTDIINAGGRCQTPPSSLHSPYPSPVPCLSPVSLPSSLILGGTLPGKLGKPTTYFFPLLHPRLSLFHSLLFTLPSPVYLFVPVQLKCGIKWPWIGQEVGVSP